MHAVEIHPRREQIGGARQAERSQIAAVRSTPQSNVSRVHVRAASQIQPRAFHVVELTRAGGAIIDRLTKVEAISDSTAIVDRQDHITLARQVLIHAVRVVVVFPVMPGRQHLPARPAVHEDHRGMTWSWPVARWQETLSVDGPAVRYR